MVLVLGQPILDIPSSETLIKAMNESKICNLGLQRSLQSAALEMYPSGQPSTPTKEKVLSRRAGSWVAYLPDIFDAVKNNESGFVVALLAEGQGHNVDPQGNTPLHWAALNDHPSMARLLLAHGAALEVGKGLSRAFSQLISLPVYS